MIQNSTYIQTTAHSFLFTNVIDNLRKPTHSFNIKADQ